MKISDSQHVTKTGQIKQNPHKTLYLLHGTTKRRAVLIKERGTKDLYVTTSAFSAHHFAVNQLHDDDDSGPALLEIKTNVSNVYWARWDVSEITGKATLRQIGNEDEERYKRNGNEYLFVKGIIKPEQITILSDKVTTSLVRHEEARFKDESRMSDDIFGPSPEERRERNGKSK